MFMFNQAIGGVVRRHRTVVVAAAVERERDKSMGSCFTSFLELVLFPIPVRNSFTVMAVCYSV